MSVDLRTTYLGFELHSPLVASASPLTGDLDRLLRLEDCGAAAVVLPSLFEEEIEHEVMQLDSVFNQGAYTFAEALTYLPEPPDLASTIDRHLEVVQGARERLRIPVIASLNGTSLGGWVSYAQILVEAGAHALELNLYDVVADPEESALDVEDRYLALVAAITAEVKVPVAVKISPWLTSPAHFARALVSVGADALVLFNRFYQPDIDLDTMSVRPRLVLSTSEESRLPLHWIAMLRDTVPASLAATSGVHTAADVVKLLLAGADVVMSTSSLLRHGPEHLEVLESGLRSWMEEHEYDSVEQLKGSMSRRAVPDPSAYQRANYFTTLKSWVSPFRA